MADMFSREGNRLAGTFSADGARFTFADGGAGTLQTGLICQSLQIQYQQQVSRIYEVGTNDTYLIAGRTSGNISIASVLGPKKVSTAFYRRYGNVCNAIGNVLNFQAQTNCVSGDIQPSVVSQNASGGTFRFITRNVVFTSYSLSVQAQEMVFNETIAGMFISLELVG